MKTVSNNLFVACSYELYAGTGEERQLVETATAEHPMSYIHGMGLMLEAFESQLMGLKEGDKFDFELTPDQAYGSFNAEYVIQLPRSIFCNDKGEFDTENVFEGNTLPMNDSEGNMLQGKVVELKDDVVVMDFNHPLADNVLHFVGKVEEVREATAEDNARFFNNEGGCGCGCGCGSDDDSSCSGGCGGGCGCSC